MSMETNLHGRLRNTALPYSNGLLPLFEAVANSIHSIEEAGLSQSDGNISIEILRDTNLDFKNISKKPGPDAVGEIIGFKIMDNGIGFNEVNMKSFLMLDSEHKANKGGRGVGRLMWLKAFNRAIINSTYREGETGELQSRTFIFNAISGVVDEKIENVPSAAKVCTVVHLDGFIDRYRDSSYKTTKTISNSLLEHCLWYFVRPGGAPNISVGVSEDPVNLHELYEEHMVSSAAADSIIIKEKVFELTHIKLRANSLSSHFMALCASNRLVKEENLKGKIPGLYGNLSDESGEFVYACYVSSSFLDDKVRSERTGFDIDEQSPELFAQTELSLNEIRDGVIARAAAHLSEYLEENKKKGRARVENFVTRKAPRYRPESVNDFETPAVRI